METAEQTWSSTTAGLPTRHAILRIQLYNITLEVFKGQVIEYEPDWETRCVACHSMTPSSER